MFFLLISSALWAEDPRYTVIECLADGTLGRTKKIDSGYFKHLNEMYPECAACTVLDPSMTELMESSQLASSTLLNQSIQSKNVSKKSLFKLPSTVDVFSSEIENVSCNRSAKDETKILYPFDTIYGHINNKTYSDIELEAFIAKAVAAGTDPYMALALALMESGSSNVNDLFIYTSHDRHKNRGMGWSKTMIKNSNKVMLTTKWADEDRFKNYFESTYGPVDASKTSYICSSAATSAIYDFNGFNVYDTPPKEYNLCQKVNFDATVGPLNEFLALNYIRKMSEQQGNFNVDMPTSLSENPPLEFVLQNFQSFSKNTGTGMVGMIGYTRLGTNTIKTPAYGLQAMDYMVNSLMANPKIKALIETQTAGKKIKSAWCGGKVAGTYAVADTHYYNQTKDMTRFESLHNIIKPNLSLPIEKGSLEIKKIYDGLYDSGDISDKKPILKELLSSNVRLKLIENGIPEADFLQLENHFNSFLYNMNSAHERLPPPPSIGKMLYIYFKDVYPVRKTSELAAKDENATRTWERLY